jgi:hypothetical protein
MFTWGHNNVVTGLESRSAAITIETDPLENKPPIKVTNWIIHMGQSQSSIIIDPPLRSVHIHTSDSEQSIQFHSSWLHFDNVVGDSLGGLNQAVAEPIPHIGECVPVLGVHHPIRDRAPERVRCHVAGSGETTTAILASYVIGFAMVAVMFFFIAYILYREYGPDEPFTHSE